MIYRFFYLFLILIYTFLFILFCLGCRDACAIQETQTCHHGGRCLNKYVETGCDCVGTGYTGDSCLQGTFFITSVYQDILFSPITVINKGRTN